MGNLWSVASALHYLGFSYNIVNDARAISEAGILILPGVGSFRQAMLSLRKEGLDEAILNAVSGKQAKILGICLGMQLLGESSSEDGETQGLGLIPAKVTRFDDAGKFGSKIPHIGFNAVHSPEESLLFRGLKPGSEFYFVHSYQLLPGGLPGLSSVCSYGYSFLAAYENKNIFATQFHPEKSQTNGLKLLENFLSC
jgi:glutamine amidotransferase